MSKKILIIVVTSLVCVGIGFGAYVLSDRQNNETNIGPTAIEKNCTSYNGAIAEQCAEDYINLSTNEAGEKAKENGLVPKVTKRDGKGQINTDEGSTPIYFEIENGIVTKAYFEANVPAYDLNN